jgi:ADP-ribose pyrophosphatase YjhB (NUDIX family)
VDQISGTAAPSVIVGCCNLIEVDDRYLLVREGKPSARGRFNFPAGKPEVGESLTAAAAREAREETGLEVSPGQLVGLYHCPRTSEGFGVVNFVFATSVVGGELTTSDAHPEVRWFDRGEIAAMGRELLLRGTHIELALDDYAAGRRLPRDAIRTVNASPLPD